MAPSQRLRNVRVAWFASVLRVPLYLYRWFPVQSPETWCAGTPPCEQMNCSTPGALPGRTMARIGLRMMPPFPSSSLSFRTAGFPEYGWKAVYHGACPFDSRVLRVVRFASALRALRCLQPILVLSRGAAVRRCTTVQAASATLPQGSSFRSGLCCPGPSSLIDPMRPTRRHISISRTPLIRVALAVRPNCDA